MNMTENNKPPKQPLMRDRVKSTALNTQKLPSKGNMLAPSMQTDLFNLPGHRMEGFANASMLAGLLPWFDHDNRRIVRSGDTPAKDLESRPIPFVVGEVSGSLTRSAAIITGMHGPHKGKKIVRMNAERECDVLEALSLIATHDDRSIGVFQGKATVHFSISQIRGWTRDKYNSSEIQEALHTLNGAPMKVIVSSGSKTITYEESILTNYGTIDDTQLANTMGDQYESSHYCSFHPIITTAIAQLDMHQINSSAIINSGSLMQRYLRRQLSLRWIQASEDNPYTILGTTILKRYDYPSEITKKGVTVKMLMRPVDGAIDKLMKGKDAIISRIEKEAIKQTIGQTRRTRVTDFKYTIYPTQTFVDQQRRSLALSREKSALAVKAAQLGLKPSEVSL